MTLFCRLLKNDDAEPNPVVEVTKLVQFVPFYLTLTVHDVRKYISEELLETMFLVVTAQSIKSAYKGRMVSYFIFFGIGMVDEREI